MIAEVPHEDIHQRALHRLRPHAGSAALLRGERAAHAGPHGLQRLSQVFHAGYSGAGAHPEGRVRRERPEPAAAERGESQDGGEAGTAMGRPAVPGGRPHHADPERLRRGVGQGRRNRGHRDV